MYIICYNNMLHNSQSCATVNIVCKTDYSDQFNLYHILANSADDKLVIVSPRKQDLTVHTNCLCWETIPVKSCFLGKIRKLFQNVVCLDFYPEC